MQLNGEELIDLALDDDPDWHPNLRELFRHADPATCFADQHPHLGAGARPGRAAPSRCWATRSTR